MSLIIKEKIIEAYRRLICVRNCGNLCVKGLQCLYSSAYEKTFFISRLEEEGTCIHR